MRRLVLSFSVVFAVFVALAVTVAELPPDAFLRLADAACWPSATPEGALPPADPIWCHEPLNSGPSTFTQGANSWLDDFQHGLSDASMGAGYRTFESINSVNRTMHFRHNNHWMVDVNGVGPNDALPQGGPNFYNFGGATMRPDRSFRFENGKLVIEANVAAGIQDYDDAWPELVVSTSPSVTNRTVDDLYSYGAFGGFWTVGCRLGHDRIVVCALYDNTGRSVGQGGRVYEISYFQPAEFRDTFGGYPSGAAGAAWHECHGNDPDINCRDRFRWELTPDSLTLFVNGVQYMRHAGRQPWALPPALTDGPVYVYFSDWIYKPSKATVRFHWQHLAINPGSSGGDPPTATPTSTPTGSDPTATPTATPRPRATNTPTPTPTRSTQATSTPTPTQGPGGSGRQTITFDNAGNPDAPLNGQYPSNVIDWGNQKWYLSGPWADFATNSISFNGGGMTNATFTFVDPRRLISLVADNGSDNTPTRISLSCAGQPTKQARVNPGVTAEIRTGWTGKCRSVTVSSTNGWETNFNNLVIE